MRQGEIIADRYILHRKLGEGGMGTVWQAAHKHTERALAIKLLHRNVASTEDARKRFMREARASARINHPNIVDVLDAGELEDGTLFLALELLDGIPLSKALRSTPPLSVPSFLMVLADACKALAAAHDAGIVHRDVKPDNIYLHRERGSEYLHGKVLDFGISKFMGDLDGTTTGALVGSPHYMSPEQVKGEAAIDHRADIWALGVLMFRALTGKWPHSAANFTALCIAIGVEPPADIDAVAPTLPEALRRLVRRCLSPLEVRLSDTSAIAAALELIASDPQVASMTVAPTLRDPKGLIRSDSFRIRTPSSDSQREMATPMPGSLSQATVVVEEGTAPRKPRSVWLWASGLVFVAAGGAAGAVMFSQSTEAASPSPAAPVTASPQATETAAPSEAAARSPTAAASQTPTPSEAAESAPSASTSTDASAKPSSAPATRRPAHPRPRASAPVPTARPSGGVPGEKLGSGI